MSTKIVGLPDSVPYEVHVHAAGSGRWSLRGVNTRRAAPTLQRLRRAIGASDLSLMDGADVEIVPHVPDHRLAEMDLPIALALVDASSPGVALDTALAAHGTVRADGRVHGTVAYLLGADTAHQVDVVRTLREAWTSACIGPEGPATLIGLRTAVDETRRRWRRRLLHVREWALRSGVEIDPDMIALVLVAKENAWQRDPFDCWTRSSVYHVLRCDLPNWCSMQRLLIPHRVPETMWLYLRFLMDEDLLHPSSDPFAELLKPLRCYGWLDATGRRDTASRPQFLCECFAAYVGPPHGELQAADVSRHSPKSKRT